MSLLFRYIIKIQVRIQTTDGHGVRSKRIMFQNVNRARNGKIWNFLFVINFRIKINREIYVFWVR